MDERHWWIATKIQESFHIGGFNDNPTLLEDFLCEPRTLELINQFLGQGGLNKLFFYSDRPQTSALQPSGLQSTRQLHVVDSLANLNDVNIEETTCLYFLRHSVEKEVDPVRMEKDIFCGELRHSVLDNLNTLLSDIFLPLLKAQKDWGLCSEENKNQCLNNLERYAAALSETVNVPSSARQQVLRRPDNIVSQEFSKHRTTSYDQGIVSEYEALVTEWISTIDNALADGGDERFMDPTSGPLNELERWRRRQRMLSSIIEQLKGKECKTVIGVLITSKSKIIKKWKAIDASITDAANETKDKVKYLEALRRHFELLYHGATPLSIVTGALPGLMSSVKQMDSISRFYARKGYLGLLFTKVTNQLVNSCKEFLISETQGPGQEDLLWPKFYSEIETRILSTDPQGKTRAVKKRGKEVMPEDDTLLGRMKACITLYNTYKDMVRSLRDGLGGAHNLTHFPSISSLGAPSSRLQRGVLSRAGLSHGKSSKTPSVADIPNLSFGDSEQGHGVAFNDEESIFGHLDSFCARIRQVIDAVYTLVQYGKLAKNAEGLPRPRKEDLLLEDDASDELMELAGPGGSVASDSLDIPKSVSPTKTATMTHAGVLEGIVEEEEGVSTRADSPNDDPSMSEALSNADEINEMNSNGTGLTAQNAALLRKLYKVDDVEDDGPSVMSIVVDHMQTMKKLLESNITTAIMLDVEGREKDKFNEAYEEFLTTVQQIELYLSAYLQAVFVRKMKTHEGLDVLTRFIPVMHRYGMKRTVSEKYIDIFKWYETDLEEVKELYEKNKEDPPMVRNAPPVSGAVHWSRQLLERIEEPMKVFRENRAVVHLREFARIVKFYNRVATALVTFESLWLQQWKGCIEQAKLGLRATLLVVHPNTGEVVVNADDRVLQLVQECRWMKRLDIEIPESALAVAKQEQRFKSYMNHLELCLKEFKDICYKIREPVHGLFQTHTRAVMVALQPGLSSLAWNSMNIDAFLHQVHTANAKLRSIVDQVNHVIDTKIDSKLKKISELFLFDVEKSFERSWPPDVFTEVMLDSIGDQSEILFAYVNDIKSACHELLNILLGQGKQPSITGTKSLSAGSKHRLSATKHLQAFPSPRSEAGVTDVTADDVLVAELLFFHSELVYQSILSAICRSLITLAEAAGCDSVLETIAEDLETHQTSSPASTPYTMSPESTPYYGRSRASTGRTRTSRPDSSMSYMSDMTWTLNKNRDYTHLRFEVAVKFAIPKIIIEPTLDAVKTSLGQIAKVILSVADKVTWWAGDGVGETMLGDISDELMVQSSLRQLDGVVEDLQRDIDKHLFHFRFYDFLWKDDMYGSYYDFIANDPGTFAIKREVERLLHIEDKIQGIPKILPIGPISLETRPITDALYGFAMQWKAQYAQVLHEEGKRQLDNAINYRTSIKSRLMADVVTLDQLNGTLNLLEEVRDMENKIDAIYLPIETMYADLISYRLRLPRSEVEEVEKLRDNWQEVVDLAEKCRIRLLKERRGAFEQELDKQVKMFVVEVIQFRNSFDSQGPAVPGVQPAEAVARLHEFQEIFKLYDSKRRTLDSVSRLFGIVCKPFPELDKTGEELDLLGLLYGLFQKFIAFDNQFRDRLWADADLPKANKEVEQYWDECQSLPDKIKDWDAYNNMKNSIKFYLDVFPILHKLASKEIRNRHWLQVMGVTGSSFQLEANVFKLCHILDIGLIPHQAEIEEICHCASKELELEVKLRVTEEEWTEQVMTFTDYKRRGPIYLEKDSMEHLLEQLENAQAVLANMLTSRFVGPLREEAAGWAEKLRGVGEVLEQWLEVQDLWQYLEAVFSIPRTAKELPQEAKRFNRIDKSWSKIQRRAYDTRNVLQCTYGGEVPKGVVLRHIHEELEICFKSLTGYLDKKRQVFPRFYFLSDPVLLAVLSRPYDLESVKPHLRCIFNYVYDIRLERIQPLTSQTQRTPSPEKGILHSPTKELHASPTRSGSGHGLAGIQSRLSIDSRMGAATGMEGGVQDGTEGGLMQAIAVASKEGEMLSLDQEVPIKDGVEVWLKGLKESITKTMSSTVSNMIQDMENNLAVEELAYKYPTQVAALGLTMYWTKECELGIMEIRNDRKAIPNTSKKFVTTMSRLTQVLTKGAWKATEEHVTPLHRLRLESMIAQSYYLRDILDNMGNRKLRELTDFEWRRCIRVYPKQRSDGSHEPQMTILEERHPYGNEFFGGQSSLVVTPITERCFLTMAMCMNQFRGSALTGGTGVGKTETVKGLAFFLGRYLALFGCSPHSDPAALGKVVQGLAMDGSWGCFDEFQLLHKEAVAMVLDHVHAVISALQARKKIAILGDGEEITLGRNIALFITVNNETGLHGDIPTDIKLLFRTVSLVVPDMSLILKARCAAYGFRSPKVLADRLKMVVQQCKDQLNPGDAELFNLKSMVTVLLHAVSSWRDVEGSKEYHQLFSIGSIAATVMFASMGRKLTKEERMELSRASSQGSLVQPGSAMPSAAMLKTVEKQPRKMGNTNPMTPAAKAEHAVVAQALQDIVGPRLKPDALYLFNNVIKDVFNSVGDAPTPHSSRARRNKMSVENMVIEKAQENGLVASSPWVAKVMQLYAISQVNHGVIVAGGPGTGKSTCIQILVEALSAVNPAQSRQSRSSVSSITSISHKLQRISPLVVDDLSLMFGYINQNHDWTDGVFTNVWKKANRNVSTTWLCLDGPLTPSWTDNFNTVLDNDRVLNLRNGDRLFLADNVKLLFETDSLSNASPASVARAGIVYLDREVLGWRPVAQAWLENRNQQEIHCLQKAFNKTMDAVVNYVLFETKPLATLTEVGTFKTCLGLLESMLNEHIEIGGELHIERLFLFCLIWTFGGLLEGSDRKGFSDLLRTLTSALPDYDHDISVFDYYVDESGEWDPWISKVPDVAYTDTRDLLGDVLVDTVDTIRTRVLMEFANLTNMHVMLLGPPGCGKTAMINDFINTLDSSNQITKRLVFSGASTASQLQQFIEANIHHRQGFVYGARDTKRFQLFVDDINLPPCDEHGVQRCNELMRQLLDERLLITLQKPFEWRTIEDLVVLSACTMNNYPSSSSRKIPDRLLRHFVLIHLPEPKEGALSSIVDAVLDGNMTKHNGQSLAQELQDAIVNASCKLLTSVQKVLRPTPMPGRYHYMFTLRDISKTFQCLIRLSEESRGEMNMVSSLWRHEVQRIMRDRLCRTSDINWFDKNLDEICKAEIPQSEEDEGIFENFVTFPIEHRGYQRPVTSMSQKTVRVILQPVSNLEQVHKCILSHLTRYNEEFGNVTLNIMLSDDVIYHVIRMHRVLSFHHGGSMMLVGAIGSHLTTLVNLALHVADMPIHPMDCTKANTFFDGLRSAVRLSGTEGKMLTLMFTGRDLKEDVYLDAINSILICGEYPPLFSNDELDGLLQALTPAMKRRFPNILVDPMKFFVSRVKTNLHIILCLPPTHRLLKIAPGQYPGLLSGMQMNWVCDWSQSALLGEGGYYIQKHNLAKDSSIETRDNLVTCMSTIHSFALGDCNQIPWAGSVEDKIKLTTLKLHGKKEIVKVHTQRVDNLPYTKLIMKERIKQKHYSGDSPGKQELFVGPRTFRRFMDCFRYIYNNKSKENTAKVGRLKKALNCLARTYSDCKNKRLDIRRLHTLYEEASKRTADLLQQLTGKATILEKTKAQYTEASNSLSAFLHMNEVESDEEIEDQLLIDDERDEYDREFDRMREENLKSRKVAIEEDLATVRRKMDECRATLQKIHDQVMQWKEKVDRPCIERLKSFTNPPPIVLQVMEMVMALLGKNKPVGNYQGDKSLHLPSNEEASMMSGRQSTSSSGGMKSPSKWKSKGKDQASDKQRWKQIAVLLQDSVKFVDMLHGVSWQNGLHRNILANVEYYLPSKNKDGDGVTGEGSLLDIPGGPKLPPSSRRSPSPGDGAPNITIAATRYSSEDAGNLVAYICAMVEYTHSCGPLQNLLKQVKELEEQQRETERLQKEKDERDAKEASKEVEPVPEPEKEYTEADIPILQEEVTELQRQFDASVVEKHSLEIELSASNERLRAATNMIVSLQQEKERWQTYVDENADNEWLLSNCMTAAAFLTYCGGMTSDSRQRMGEYINQVCVDTGFPIPKRRVLKDVSLIQFLYTPFEIESLKTLKLPSTPNSQDNACFVMQEHSATAWSLLCDPTSRILDWIKSYLNNQLVVIKFHELRAQLETCLTEGTPLVLMDCDVDKLAEDPRFYRLLRSRLAFINGKSNFKMMVADHEVECHPGFRLYLHTTCQPHCVPDELAAYTSVMYFYQTREDCEEELLDRFMTLEKARLEEDRITALKERISNMKQLDQLEDQMLECLASDNRLLNDLATTKKLADMKKHYDETVESQERVQISENAIHNAREGYRSIARRGAVCFDVSRGMSEVNFIYQTSWQQFLETFDISIKHSERSAAVKAVVERLTYNAFQATARSLLERDRHIYSVFLAMEVEDSIGNVGYGEREYVISPQLGSATMSGLGLSAPSDHRVCQIRKPFDWMLDDQFHSLQSLAINFEWFQDMFERMPKDGRETQWRTLGEHENPELHPLPEKMDDNYNPMQRLMVIRAFRPDRIMQAATVFVGKSLGKKYTNDVAIDPNVILRQTSPVIPVLLLYTREGDVAEKIFHEFSAKKQVQGTVVNLSNAEHNEERRARKAVQHAMQEGTWVMLKSAHNATHLLNSLETLLQENDNKQGGESPFRVWISAQVSRNIPVRLLQYGVKVVIDTPKIVKESLLRAVSSFEPEQLKASSRSEWVPLLHNIAMVHATVRLRGRYGLAGWNYPDIMDFSHNELSEAFNIARMVFSDSQSENESLKGISWMGLRYILTEIIYGSYINDDYDRTNLSAMVDYWIGPNATKREFEATKLKFRIPPAFFSNFVRVSSLTQSIEALPNHFLDVPEACGMHTSYEDEWRIVTVLGDDQYVFTRLNQVLDAMPSTKTLSHVLQPRPATPFHGPSVASVNGTALQPNVADMGVYASASHSFIKSKRETEIWEICHNIVHKIPKGWNRDYITERVRKIGGDTPFNRFVLREIDLMIRLIADLKATFNKLKHLCENPNETFGDQMSERLIDIADDLFHHRIPSVWAGLCGDSAPPPNWTLAQWMSDLSHRCQHLERIIVQGKDKFPAYWLGAFFHPRALLALLKQDAIRAYGHNISQSEPVVFQTEITARDKDHVRDPPQEGMFVYGVYVWGCSWEKTTGELQDSPPRHGATLLPIIHITTMPYSEKPAYNEQRTSEMYLCPVYPTRICARSPVFLLDVKHDNVSASKWALRGLAATIRPY